VALNLVMNSYAELQLKLKLFEIQANACKNIKSNNKVAIATKECATPMILICWDIMEYSSAKKYSLNSITGIQV
jgi:hypothetical protein